MNLLRTAINQSARLSSTVVLTLLLVGCGTGADTVAPGVTATAEPGQATEVAPSPQPTVTVAPTEAPAATATTEPSATATVPVATPTVEATPAAPSNSITEEAIQIVSEATGIAPENLKVISVEEVMWPSSAGGCPQPGRLYQDVIVPGLRIIVEGEGQTFYVHGGEAGRLRLCENPEEPVPGGSPVDPDVDAGDGAVAVLAATATIAPPPMSAPSATPEPPPTMEEMTMSDPTSTPPATSSSSGSPYEARAIVLVAEFSSLPPESLKVVSAEEVTWSDSSLGCPKPGRMYMQVIVPGTRIVVEGNGQRFYVHGSRLENLFVCDAPKDPILN